MKTKITLVAVLAVTAGAFFYARPHNHIPSDLRDAPADTWSDGTAMGQLDARHGASEIKAPDPKAAAAGEEFAGRRPLAPGSVLYGKRIDRQTFSAGLSLDPATFRDRSESLTKEVVYQAFKGKGMTILSYRDHYSVRHAEFVATGKPDSRKIIKALEALPEVAEVREKEAFSGPVRLAIAFKDGIYPPRLKEIFDMFADLEVAHAITYGKGEYGDVRNAIDVEIEVTGNPERAAMWLLKNMYGIKKEKNGMKLAGINMMTFSPGSVDTEALGVATCMGDTCTVSKIGDRAGEK
ncbi:MAG: hypothetical protein M0011_00180 [Elusimicrobia bacterium]|nr:hypothetical protein [Elusimicrobiota bacterium]